MHCPLSRLFVLAGLLSLSLAAGCAGCDDGGSGWELGADAGPDARNAPDLGVPETCGDGQLDPGEVCDGQALGEESCQTFGFSGGEIECMESCAGYLVVNCTGVPSWSRSKPHGCQGCESDEMCERLPTGEFTCRAVCNGEALVDESQLDTDVRTHQVSGTVTIDGQPVSEWTEEGRLGEVIFRPNASPHTEVFLQEGGVFEVELFEGTYDVYWRGKLTWPSLPFLVAEDVRIDRAQSFSFDMPAPDPATLHIEAPEWFGSFSARVELRADAGAARDSGFRIQLDLDAAPRHRVNVWIDRPLEVSVDEVESELPENQVDQHFRHVRPSPVVMEQPLSPLDDREFMLPIRRLRLSVPPSGAAPEGERVQALLAGEEPPEEWRRASIGPIEIDFGQEKLVPLFPGEVWLHWKYLGAEGAIEVPVEGDVDETVPVDVRYVQTTLDLSGLGLSELDAGESTRLTVDLRHERFGDLPIERNYELSEAIDLVVPQGTYDVRVAARSDEGTLAVWDAYDLEVREGVVGRGRFEQVEKVRLVGEVLRRGEQMPDNDVSRTYSGSERGTYTELEPRGDIRFECIDDCFGGGWHTLGAEGAALYEVSLEPGVYKVWVVTPSGDDWNLPTNQTVLPPPGYVLDPHLVVERGGRRDFDIRMVRIDVSLREDGGELSPLASWPEWLKEREPDRRGTFGISSTVATMYGFTPHSASMGTKGPASATLYGYPAHYSVSARLNDIGTVREFITADDDKQVDFDVSLAHLSGQLTRNGQPWQGTSIDRGELRTQVPGFTWRTHNVDDDGSFGFSLLSRPTQLLWQRWRAYSNHSTIGRFVLFDGCADAE